MAVTEVGALVVTIGGSDLPVSILDDDPALVGQVVLDYVAANENVPEFTVNVKRSTRKTTDA
jgi:hypothetical protein